MKLLASTLLAALSLWLLSASLRHWPVHAPVREPTQAVPRAPAPVPARRASAAPKAQEARPAGNTDGGMIPWNGGDLHMRDYSSLTHPKDGAPR